MRDTFLAWNYIPASANGGFRPSLLSVEDGFRSAAREGFSGGVPRLACTIRDSLARTGLPYSSPSSPLGVRIRLLVQCRLKLEGCQR